MSKDTSNYIQIELHVPNFEQVLGYYGRLGFEKVWLRSENDNADYLVMHRSGTILNFWSGNESVYEQPYFKRFPRDTKRGYGVEVVIPVDNIREFYEEMKLSVNVVEPLVRRPWGVRDFRIEDPFGYYLRITERHDITDVKHKVPGV